MTVWVLSAPLQGDGLPARLAIPFGDAPNLAALHSLPQLRQMLQAQHPLAPPETIQVRASRLWEQYEALQREDVIAVPLPGAKAMAVAEITRPYIYDARDGVSERHWMEVTWAKKRAPYRPFATIAPHGGVREITDPALRARLRRCLPYGYNRFASLKWMVAILMILNLIIMLSRMLHPMP